ncbi:hypothetical protein [Microvirga sp. VF16]|uniref:hypothetical protein n=1 Tax=Microvirga sp. VF16 TaxID=2807101 RepID=UPI00193E6501|nr:hypothetical protein [Microvirga sp. VF16]QRM33546.1 hypothetical protein JO965_36570 [Microvirga sp. VF16]
MADQRILLNLDEGLVLRGIVVFQAGGMFEQVGLAGLIPVFSPALGQTSLFARIVHH